MADTEKITINMSAVDLGQIDLLVTEGFYSNRTDFIRSAIRAQINSHGDAIKQVMYRKSMVIGVLSYSASELEARRAKNEKLIMKVVGMVLLADDITPELALATIESIEVKGVLKVSEAVRQALGDRIKGG